MKIFKYKGLGVSLFIAIWFASSSASALDISLSPGDDIQNAIDQVVASGGGTVSLASGTYILPASIEMSSNVTLQGAGNTTRLELPLDATYPMIIDDGTEPCNNMTVRNMLLDGNIPESKVSHNFEYTTDPQNPCLGILFDAGTEATYHTNVIIENLEIHNTVDACHIKGVRGGYIDNVYFHHNGIFFWPGHNAYLRRCIDYTVKNSIFEASYNGSGVNCSWSKNLLFSNCQVIASGGRGIRNAASEGFVIHDCIITDCGSEGIIANAEQSITTSKVDFRRNCISGCNTGMTGGASGVAFDNNVFNSGTNYSLGSAILQSGNTSSSSLSCTDQIVAWDSVKVSAAFDDENPKQVIVEIAENIAANDSYEGLSLKVDGADAEIADITLLSSTQLSITLVNDVTSDQVLTLSYAESGNIQTVSGVLKAFTDLSVVNNSASLIIQVESTSVDVNGEFVTLKFDKLIGTIHDQSDNFSFIINGETVGTTMTYPGDSTINIYPESKIYLDDVLTVSYSPGDYAYVSATDNSKLLAFSGLSLDNVSTLDLHAIPGKIEAEDYESQSGIELENCSEGGQNIAYINTDDWAEYKVEVFADTTYQALFRLATKNDSCSITVYVDGNQKGIVSVPNTGDWQGYQSSSVDMKLSSGVHMIKIVFTGSFNVNWMDFSETAPGNEANSYYRIEAEDYVANSGTSVEDCSDIDGGQDVGSIRDGNWLMYSDVDLTDAVGLDMRLASTTTGSTVEVRLGSITGEVIASLDVPTTGGWQTWETVSAELDSIGGIYDIYLVFGSTGSWVCNVNWFQFSYSTVSTSIPVSYRIDDNSLSFSPNPVQDELTVEDTYNSQLAIFNISGQKVYDEFVTDYTHRISTAGLKPGIYFLQQSNENGYKMGKFLKE